jgi:glutamate-ammonia-ligase adenylyltransferase
LPIFGYESRDAFAKDLVGHLNMCRGTTAACSRAIRPARRSCPISTTAGPDDKRLLDYLLSLGFKKPAMVATTVQQWLTGDHRAPRFETRSAFVEFSRP